MTEPEPTQPEPTDDPGHILPQDVWDAIEDERNDRLMELGVLDEHGEPVEESTDPNLDGTDD